MKYVKFKGYTLCVDFLKNNSMSKCKKITKVNTPEEVLETLWIKINGKPKPKKKKTPKEG